jgi:adenylate cyclase
MRMFENALAIDGDFAAPYAGLGEASAYMYEWYDGDTAWLARAIEMNTKALEREPASVEARFGIAMVYYHQRRVTEARRTLEEVLAADPQHVLARLRLGMLAEQTGTDLAGALAHYQRAAELHPHDDDPWRYLSALHRKLGNTSAANEAAIRVIEITSRKLEASIDDVFVMSRLAEAYALFGGPEETHSILRRILELDPSDGLVLYNCACAHALLGEREPALLFLRRAYDSGFRAVARSARADSAFGRISSQPEFQRLIAELE